MKIPVELELVSSEDGRGVKTLVRAMDGTGRRWFKWYESEVLAAQDAERMQLIGMSSEIGMTEARFLELVKRRLLYEAEIDAGMLDRYWRKDHI